MAITDTANKFSNGTQPLPTTLSAQKLAGATTASLTSATGWDTSTAKYVRMYNTTVSGSQTIPDQSTLSYYKATLSGTTLSNLTLIWSATGSDQTYAAGATVDLSVSSGWTDDLVTNVLTHADQDGTLKADSVDVTAVIKDGVITNTKMSTEIRPNTLLAETTFDFVASGGVWTGDSYNVTLYGSMTAAVVYIGGVRVSVSAVTAHLFTASKDTYIDVGADGVVDYTEVTTNAASPALAASHIRLGIVCSGASSIVNVGYINQGQENKTVPVASSIMYSVTDSLGNLICPRDPNRRILGQRQILSGQGSITTAVDITGLNSTVIVPSGRKVIVSVFAQGMQSTSTGTTTIDIKMDGTVIQSEIAFVATATGQVPVAVRTPAITPSAGSHTYKVTVAMAGGGNGTFNANSTNPAYIMVELA